MDPIVEWKWQRIESVNLGQGNRVYSFWIIEKIDCKQINTNSEAYVIKKQKIQHSYLQSHRRTRERMWGWKKFEEITSKHISSVVKQQQQTCRFRRWTNPNTINQRNPLLDTFWKLKTKSKRAREKWCSTYRGIPICMIVHFLSETTENRRKGHSIFSSDWKKRSVSIMNSLSDENIL